MFLRDLRKVFVFFMFLLRILTSSCEMRVFAYFKQSRSPSSIPVSVDTTNQRNYVSSKLTKWSLQSSVAEISEDFLSALTKYLMDV